MNKRLALLTLVIVLDLSLMIVGQYADAQSTRYPGSGGGGGSVTSITASSPLTGGTITTSGSIGIPAATSSVDGYLAHGDWSMFNSKQPALSATAGSVLFSGGGSTISQDNANLFWDSTNHRLGIGTNAPATPLDMDGAYTVVSATGAPINLHTAITAHANSDTPAGIYINPTWATGGFSNVLGTVARFNAVSSVVATTALELDTDGNYGTSAQLFKTGTEEWRLLKDGRMLNDGDGNGAAGFVNYGSLQDSGHSGMFIQPSHVGLSTNSIERISITNSGNKILGNGNLIFTDATTGTVTLTAPASVTSYSLTLPTTISGVPNGAAMVLTSGQLGFQTSPAASKNDINTNNQNMLGTHPPAFVICTAADGNQSTAGGSAVCDGQTISGGPVLLTAQTTASENGLWDVNQFGAWALDTTWPDQTGGCSLAEGEIYTVQQGGTSFGNTTWMAKCVGGNATFLQIPVATRSGACTIASTTLSTTATNLTCTGVPASTHVAVNCSGGAAFSTPTANGLYCRATGTANQVACETVLINTTAMAFYCSWVQP